VTKSLFRNYKSQRNELSKSWVFRWLQKTGRDGVDVTYLVITIQLHVRVPVSSETVAGLQSSVFLPSWSDHAQVSALLMPILDEVSAVNYH